ncbi:MAG: U2 snRNP complex subunit msl1 [Alyxoria varia]|nr:MAG: U2 snRNP complex subunit msl1 [Alyxoria varia]
MAANGVPPKPPPTLPPNQTLYCKNLPDKMNKNELRRELYMLFSTHGPVLDVVALRTPKMKGQAHIVFRDIHTSSQAMRTLQGHEFFGKEMFLLTRFAQKRISYGKGKSDMISRLDGTTRAQDLVKSQQQQQHQQTQQAQNAATDLQRSVFGGPPGTMGNVPAAQKPPPAGLPTQPAPPGTAGGLKAANGVTEEASRSPSIGTKRPREDESEDEDAQMEEDDDEGDAMEESDSD